VFDTFGKAAPLEGGVVVVATTRTKPLMNNLCIDFT
jgi:hypothetical protein